jgi:hypothetical protein
VINTEWPEPDLGLVQFLSITQNVDLLNYLCSIINCYTILLCDTVFWMQFIHFVLDVDYRLCVTLNHTPRAWGYKVEEKLHLGASEQNTMNTVTMDTLLLTFTDVRHTRPLLREGAPQKQDSKCQ